MKLIPYVPAGQVIPYGFSRDDDYVRLRFPAMLKWARGYDINSDKMDRGLWLMNVVVRFYSWRVEMRWGWILRGSKNRCRRITS